VLRIAVVPGRPCWCKDAGDLAAVKQSRCDIVLGSLALGRVAATVGMDDGCGGGCRVSATTS
jgi:hypothetical protein